MQPNASPSGHRKAHAAATFHQQQQQDHRSQQRQQGGVSNTWIQDAPPSVLDDVHAATRGDKPDSSRPNPDEGPSILSKHGPHSATSYHHEAPLWTSMMLADDPEQAWLTSSGEQPAPVDTRQSGTSDSHSASLRPEPRHGSEVPATSGDAMYDDAIIPDADSDAAEAGAPALDGITHPLTDGFWEGGFHTAQYSPSHAASHSTLHHGLQSPLGASSEQDAQHEDHELQHEEHQALHEAGHEASGHAADQTDQIADGDRDQHQFTRLWSNAAAALEDHKPHIFPQPFHSLSHLAQEDENSGHGLVEGLVNNPHFPPGSLELDEDIGQGLQQHDSFSRRRVSLGDANLRMHQSPSMEHPVQDSAADSGEGQGEASSGREPADAAGYASDAPAGSTSREMQASSASGSRSRTDSGSEEAESSDNMEFAPRYCLNCTAASSGTMCLVRTHPDWQPAVSVLANLLASPRSAR